MHYAFGVAQVDLSVVGGVEQTQFLDERLQPLTLVALAQQLAGVVVDGGNVVDAVAHCVEVHHRAARHEAHGAL